ncbi:MAG: rRNA ((1498)-N(3))-methyltransferase [Candidatus Saccharibacteria bacterium]|nr:rRNA ((1498)-N(3))-methyltransferase [Candidatus Saccharibacteria bacterium]
MRLHRFFVGTELELKHDFWLHDQRIVYQWRKVLRYQAGQQVVMFDGVTHDRLYRIEELKDNEAHLVHVTDMSRNVPKKNVYLLWSMLKKDKNDWVLQKCTELGVSHFVPLLAERSEKTGFDVERAQKIVIEASEQCGRSDIPNVREPLFVETALNELSNKMQLFICEQGSETPDRVELDELGVLIGPEGGWSDKEMALFKEKDLLHIPLGDFTLRAETAAVTAAHKLLDS